MNRSAHTLPAPPAVGEVSVKRYGAVGDGVATDTTAVQAALTAAAASGGVVVFPPGTYKCGALSLTDAVGVRVAGHDATITWTGTGSAPTSYVGLALAGTCTDVTVEGLSFVGTATAAHDQAGVYTAQSATLTNCRVVRCNAKDVAVGFQIGHSTASTVTDCSVTDCRVENAVGTTSGHGYGIVHSGATGTKILGNTVVGAQRHSIYVSAGTGVTVVGNTVRNHRLTGADGTLKSAIALDRATNIVCANNELIDTWDGSIEVVPDTSLPSRSVVVADNLIYNPHAPAAIWVGEDSGNFVCEQVEVRGNTIRVAAGVDVAVIRVRPSKHVTVAGNSISFASATTEVWAIEVPGLLETAGTALYTDDVNIEDNVISGSISGGAIICVRIGATAAASGIRMRIRNNSKPGVAGNLFSAGANISDANIFISQMATTGLTWAAGVLPAVLDTDLAASRVVRTGVAVTGSRPAAADVGKGAMFYDDTLDKPIWSDGAAWKDATGTAV